MAHSILVWIENFGGRAAAISHEALGVARSIAQGGAVTAAAFGMNAEMLATEAITLGADSAVICDDASLAEFRPEPAVALLAKVARDAYVFRDDDGVVDEPRGAGVGGEEDERGAVDCGEFFERLFV